MDVLITGEPGAGKTTICEKLVELLKDKGLTCGGVLSPISEDGFDIVDVKTGKTKPFAKVAVGDAAIGKFNFDNEGINFALKALENSNNCSVTFIDEIGPLELGGEGLMPSVKSLADSDGALVVIARSWLSEKVKGLFPKREFLVFEVTEANRDALPEEVLVSFLENNEKISR